MSIYIVNFIKKLTIAGSLLILAGCGGGGEINQLNGLDNQPNTLNKNLFVNSIIIPPDLPWVDASKYGSLEAAVNIIGSVTPVVLVVSTPQMLSASITITPNIYFVQLNTGLITISAGQTLAIGKDATTGLFQRFAGGGSLAGLSISYPEWFGAKSDGSDSTIAVQNAVNSAPGGTIIIDDAFFINATANPTYASFGGIQLLSNQTIIFQEKGSLQALPTASSQYAVLQCNGIRNVKIMNPVIIGERDGHIGSTGEWGMGIFIVGSTNIQVSGGIIKKCWGDGIYVGCFGTNTLSDTIHITGTSIEDCRRQGISFVGATNVTVEACNFTRIRGTDPQSGVDFESDSSSYPNSNAKVSGNYFKDCRIGVLIGNAYNSNIEISGNTMFTGKGIQYFPGGTNIVAIDNVIIVEP